jgi:tyrosine-protein kinase Etk/Wzc
MDLQTKVQVQLYLRLFYSKRWFILSFVSIVLLGTILFLENEREKFRSSTTILIDKSNSSTSGLRQDIFTSSMGLQTELQNHIEHLKSYSLSERVYEYLEEKRDEYPLIFEVFNETHSKRYPDRHSKISFLRSSVSVDILNRQSDIIKLSVEAYSAEEAKFLADIYHEVYSNLTLEIAKHELNNLNSYLIEELAEKEKLLMDAEEALNSFKTSEGIQSLSRQTENEIDRFSTMKVRREEIQIEIESNQEAKRTLDEQIKKSRKEISVNNIDYNTSFINKISEKIAEKKVARDELELRVKSNNYSMDLFQGQIDQFNSEIKLLEKQLNERLQITSDRTVVDDPFKRTQQLQQQYLSKEVKIKSLQRELFLIDENLGKLDSETSRLPEKELRLMRLERNVEIYRKINTMLVEKRQENDVLISSKKNNIRLIDRGLVIRTAVYPKKSIVLAGAIFGSIGLSFLIIFLIEYLDNTVKSEDELKQYKLNKLGVVPNIPQKENDSNRSLLSRTFIHHEPKSIVAESFRSIRTNMLFQMRQKNDAKEKKSILLTSCGPQEGKSTTICNLAICFAEQGKKTVIIDADLRRPVIHSVFGGDKNEGLSNFLYGEMSIEEILNKTNVENLFTINSGIIPPNPSELLSLPEVDTLIKDLEKRFDFILFDTPPIIAVTDASVLASKVDATTLVIRASKTDRDMIPESVSKLTAYENNLMGCILNDFDFERHYGYKYQYYNYYNSEKKA